GTVEDVLRRGQRTSLRVGVPDLAKGVAVLRDAGIAARPNHTALEVDLPAADAARVSEALGRQGIWVTELQAEAATLEDVFLELTTIPTLEEAVR
ncbi:MAG TPA: ABC transporter ATP-binding protein, partial [Ornithinibacter sp.]|nr:ABC transporter ATP-binding protein [Ornithinibacter sp.]